MPTWLLPVLSLLVVVLAVALVLALRRGAGQGGAEQWQGLLTQFADRLELQSRARSERLADRFGQELGAQQERLARLQLELATALGRQREESAARSAKLEATLRADTAALRAQLTETTLKTLAEQARADRELLQQGLKSAAEQLATSIAGLTRNVDGRLESIAGQVSLRLDEGFRKTNETFASVMARLATIDEAQKKIDGLTTNVVSLQELLGDKRSRGAFGEVQLEGLVRNVLPPDAYAFQEVLPGNVRADCVLRLPPPTGLVAVDAKFPLENYQRMYLAEAPEADRAQARTAFRQDVKRHIDAIAGKYIIPGTTADGAVMFVPAEAVFAEIHAGFPELVAHAQGKRVWIVSPTTLMAVLNTARAVLRDVETRRQVHLIQDALAKLAKDFKRFDERMGALARHIEQASKDVQDVHVSSRKISAHFERIEAVRLEEDETAEAVAQLPGEADQPPM